MSNLSKTLRDLLLFFLFLALTAHICQPSPLCAGTIYQFNAKGKTEGPYQGVDFALRYYDADGDNLFSLDELIPGTFTGVTLSGVPYTAIVGVPINGWFSLLTDGPPFFGEALPQSWTFYGSNWMTVFGGYWTYSQTTVASGEIEQWKLISDGGQGSGNCTLIKTQAGTVTADGDWTYTYQGANVSGRYSDAPVTIAGASISITASGTATNPSAPPGYQTSPFTLSISGRACNGHGSGTFTLTFTTFGWPPSISGSWEGTRKRGSGITAVAMPWIQLLLLDD